jgi:hypothetical protein
MYKQPHLLDMMSAQSCIPLPPSEQLALSLASQIRSNGTLQRHCQEYNFFSPELLGAPGDVDPSPAVTALLSGSVSTAVTALLSGSVSAGFSHGGRGGTSGMNAPAARAACTAWQSLAVVELECQEIWMPAGMGSWVWLFGMKCEEGWL